MTKFRPCIDLHAGQVKQIIGATLMVDATEQLRTNYVSTFPASYFAALYKEHGLTGAHIIMLGPGNESAANDALVTWPGAFQIGGGMTDETVSAWIERGAGKVIITSFLFPEARFSLDRLRQVLNALNNNKDQLVIDLSCKRHNGTWLVAMNKWQTLTNMEVNQANIKMLEQFCSEFLVHAADCEGLQNGIDEELVLNLAQWCSIPVTYAGGARCLEDLDLVKQLSSGKVDLTIGSALDVFGGSGVTLTDCVTWNKITPSN